MTESEIWDKLHSGSRIYAATEEERDEVFDRLDDLGYNTEEIRGFWRGNHERRNEFYIGLSERIGNRGNITTWSSRTPYLTTLYIDDIVVSHKPSAKLSDADFKSALDAFLS